MNLQMTRISIPENAWMRLKQRGQFKYARKKSPIVWTNRPPETGTEVYVVAWYGGQGPLQASGVIKV